MDRDTGEYSSTKAPDTRKPAEERDATVDTRLIPGGAEPRSNTDQGMAGLDRDAVPGRATAVPDTPDDEEKRAADGE